ncbi:MAG: dockerin type I repeat-containing protein [Planctomycetaceae bacterium]|nr:dockerin type I repeat-containing protein [Planctomycetaceae bacterium]
MHIGKSSRDLFTPQASITLGRRNTIRTDRIVLGVGTINATIQGRADSELQLGEPNRRVDVAIASGELGATTRKFTSALDLSRTATTAWLGDVSVGDGHADNPLALTGRLAFGPNSHIEARSITLAQGNATGILELSGGELLVERIARGAGAAQFKWTGGTLEVGEFGDDDFAFDLANLGQGILGIPDVSGLATIHGDYSQGPQATLEVHGRAAGVEQVSVTGNATLSGTLKLRLEPGFHPVVGETFLLVAAAGVGGTFDRVTGFLAGDTFLHPLYSASSIELRAYRAGDGNLDGAVDGADYTRWSDHYLTTTHQGVAAGDYNGDGLVDGADYTLWADHFTAAPSLTLATHAVPEPSSRLLALLGIVLGAAVSRGRAQF